MLRLPSFRYHRPRTLDEAAGLLAEERAAGRLARLVAGGTDLWPNLKRRNQKADAVISLAAIPGLAEVRLDPANGDLVLGAMAPLAALGADPAVGDRYPALRKAVLAISSPLLRNAGTLGGNLCLDTRCTYYDQSEEWRRSIDYCMKEAGQVCWVAPGSPRCWAVSSSDAAPALCALEARVRLHAAGGNVREIPVEGLYRDDGIDYLAKRPDEILADVRIPAASAAPACRQGFEKLRRRGSIDFAVASAASALWLDGEGRIARARIWLGAVGSAPVRATASEDALLGQAPAPDALARAAALARREATPMDNTDFDPRWRGAVLGSLLERCLQA